MFSLLVHADTALLSTISTLYPYRIQRVIFPRFSVAATLFQLIVLRTRAFGVAIFVVTCCCCFVFFAFRRFSRVAFSVFLSAVSRARLNLRWPQVSLASSVCRLSPASAGSRTRKLNPSPSPTQLSLALSFWRRRRQRRF